MRGKKNNNDKKNAIDKKNSNQHFVLLRPFHKLVSIESEYIITSEKLPKEELQVARQCFDNGISYSIQVNKNFNGKYFAHIFNKQQKTKIKIEKNNKEHTKIYEDDLELFKDNIKTLKEMELNVKEQERESKKNLK